MPSPDVDGYDFLGWSRLDTYDAAGARSKVTAAFYRCLACAATVTCTGPTERTVDLTSLTEHTTTQHRSD